MCTKTICCGVALLFIRNEFLIRKTTTTKFICHSFLLWELHDNDSTIKNKTQRFFFCSANHIFLSLFFHWTPQSTQWFVNFGIIFFFKCDFKRFFVLFFANFLKETLTKCVRIFFSICYSNEKEPFIFIIDENELAVESEQANYQLLKRWLKKWPNEFVR